MDDSNDVNEMHFSSNNKNIENKNDEPSQSCRSVFGNSIDSNLGLFNIDENTEENKESAQNHRINFNANGINPNQFYDGSIERLTESELEESMKIESENQDFLNVNYTENNAFPKASLFDSKSVR